MMSAFEEHLNKVLSFLEEYQSIVDSHLVDFITEDLWNKCLPQQLRIELESLSIGSITKNHLKSNDVKTPELNKFLGEIDLLSLEKCNFVYNWIDLPDLFSTWGFEAENLDSENIENTKLKFMSEKKCHEVQILGKVTSSLAKFHSNIIIDAGAGKGYLSEFISQKYKYPVLAIDSSHINHKGAVKRQSMMRKKSSRNPPLVHHVVQWIDDDTDLKNLAETNFPGQSLDKGLTITGLHTCGSLGHSVIKAFLKTECIRSLCIVTCCYHLCDTLLSRRLSFSKNAKMLAQQSVERMDKNEYSSSPTLYYRAVLQVLFHSLGLFDVKVGRGAPIDDFVTYAEWALTKIGIDSNKIPEDSVLQELYNSHKNYKLKMEIFQTLRIRLGSVVESAILLDRMIYLESSKVCANLALVRLFDPVISPRCYSIIAIK